MPTGLGTPLGNICSRSPNTDFSSSSSIVSIDDRISRSREASKVVSKRTLVYKDDTSPIKKTQKQPGLINPSKTMKEVYVKLFLLFVHTQYIKLFLLFVYTQYVTMCLSLCYGM